MNIAEENSPGAVRGQIRLGQFSLLILAPNDCYDARIDGLSQGVKSPRPVNPVSSQLE